MAKKLAEPHDTEAEEILLGYILGQPEILDSYEIASEVFYTEYYRHIYEAILGVRLKFEPVNTETISGMAKDYDFPPALLSAIYTNRLPATDDPAIISYYIERLNKALKRRKLIFLGMQIKDLLEQAYSDETNPDEITDAVLTRAAELASLGTGKLVSVKCLQVKRATPPFYIFDVYGQHKRARLSFRSGQVLSKQTWVCKIMDALQFIPTIPKNFFEHISNEISHAPRTEVPDEAREDTYLLNEVRDFIASGFQAEDVIDFESRGRPGYIDRKAYRWFKGGALCDMLKTKTNLDKGAIWNILSDNNAQKKSLRLGQKFIWLWGLPISFFTEQKAPEEPEEITLDDIFEDIEAE